MIPIKLHTVGFHLESSLALNDVWSTVQSWDSLFFNSFLCAIGYLSWYGLGL